jgi:hypothetical protein
VIHHMPGWDEWTCEVARKFAHHGYAAVAPSLQPAYPRLGGTGRLFDAEPIFDVVESALSRMRDRPLPKNASDFRAHLLQAS